MVKIKGKEKKVTEVLNEKADASKNEEKAASVKEKSAGSDMITVACGIPMGLKLNLPSGDLILKGVPMSHVVSAVKGVGYLPAGKFGLTAIKKSQWEEILAQYGRYDFIVNGVVFAKDSYEETVEKSKERSGEKLDGKLGFEQADPKKGLTQKKKGED